MAAKPVVTIKEVRLSPYAHSCSTAYIGNNKVADVCWSPVMPGSLTPYLVSSSVFGRRTYVKELSDAIPVLQSWASHHVMSFIESIQNG